MIKLKNTIPNALIVFLGLFSWLATILLAMPVWADEQISVVQEPDEPGSIHQIDADRPAIEPATKSAETGITGEATKTNELTNESTNETAPASETTQLIEAVQASDDALLPIEHHSNESVNASEPT